MAVVGLAGSVAVNAATPEKVTTFPTVTGATTGAGIVPGDVVRLDYANTGWQIDFTGTPGVNSKKDSLLMTSAATIARSKAHIDSLLFKVSYEKKSLDYDGTPTFEYSFTFTSKVGKFAFAKPEAKKIEGAYLNTNGVLNEWVLPAAYLTVSTSQYIPFVVATREAGSDKPKTVYVLAYTNDAAMKFTVMEINYDDALAAAVTGTAFQITYDATTGIGTLGSAGAYTAYRIAGWEVNDLSFDVTAANIEDAIGFETPSFKFPAGNLVSAEEENLLAAYNWEYTADSYMKAIGAKQAVTGRDLYLTVDTAFYDVANKRNFKLALDTLPGTTHATAKMIRNVDMYKFAIKSSFTKDSITISAENTPKVQTNGYFKRAGDCIEATATPEALIIKKFGNKTALTTQYAGDATLTPCITASEFPTKELNDEDIAQFTSGYVYTIFDMNKTKADGKTANPDYGKALIIDNMNDRVGQLFVKAEKFDNTLPSHQWVAMKKDNINVYTFKNRETAADVNETNTKLADVQLFVVDANKFLYTYGDRKDTIKLEKLDQTKLTAFDGYQHITREAQMNQTFNLRFVSELLGEEAFVQEDADSVMSVALNNKEAAAEVRFLQIKADIDTLKLGADQFNLTAVPYAVKIGRYFLAYDGEKKVYRFTEKQRNEAEAEASYVYDKFMITKLVGGNVALVPVNWLKDKYVFTNDKLSIDSENGKAVRVALDSDLRHTFELTAPVNRIFAQVLPKADTTLVTVNIKSVENADWKIAKGADDFAYEGVPSLLKAGGAEYDKAAFDFQLDTAYVQRAGNTMPLYYIISGGTRHDSTFVAHNHDVPNHVCPPLAVNDTVSGKFLFMMNDSLTTRANQLKYGYVYNESWFAKLQFVNAKHVKDTLIVNAGRVTPLAADTMKAGAVKAETKPEFRQTEWLAAGNTSNEALFAFRVNMDNKEEYAIYNPATGKYISYLNGFVVASDDAQQTLILK